MEWIKLNTETPPIPSKNYLVFKDNEIKISLWRGGWNMFHCDINRNINEPYVHWAELPNPPSNLKKL